MSRNGQSGSVPIQPLSFIMLYLPKRAASRCSVSAVSWSSRTGSAAIPNDWNLEGGPDLEEQSRFYLAMFGACGKRDWVWAFMLWDWPAQLYPLDEAAGNDDYCMYGKPAAGIIEAYYGSKTKSLSTL